MNSRKDPLGIYVHIPFCVHKCPYCDFNSRPVESQERRQHLEALIAEIRQTSWRGSPADTVFFGGGTPSELTREEFEAVAVAVRKSFDLSNLVEWTVECNPGTVSATGLAAMKNLGVNRISLGVQSFSDGLLRRLGRIHTSAAAVESYRQVRAAGFDNVNLDLMFALPGQSLEDWTKDLSKAVALGPEHLSLYNLTYEPGTEFDRLRAAGRLVETDEDLAAAMMQVARERTERAGYRRYEISNYCREGRECRHNLKYWTNRPYLGFGVSASSYVQGRRWTNTGNWQRYREGVLSGQVPPAADEQLDNDSALGEEIMLRLRLSEGFSSADLSRRYGCDIAQKYGREIDRLSRRKLIETDGDRIRLTEQGFLLASDVSLSFMR